MNIFKRLVERAKECESYGFYWTDSTQLFNQISSECEEIKEALNGPKEHLQEEIGDLMDAVVELCVYLNFDPEEALVKSANKFDKRYNHLKEEAKKEGLVTLKNESRSKVLQLWEQAKLIK